MVNSEQKTSCSMKFERLGVVAKWKIREQLRQFYNIPRKEDVFDLMEAVGRKYLDELG